MTPVPYPKSNAAYPTAKPEPIAASAVTASNEVTHASNFFPLVPTASSKYVAEEAKPEPVEVTSSVLVEPETHAEPSIVEDHEAAKSPDEFDISSSLTREPQTNSIVVPEVIDPLLTGEIFTDTGEVLITGSIELPPITGEMAIVSESPDSDRADEEDSSSLTLTTVAPVRAPSVVNSKAAVGTIPSKHRRTSGQMMTMLTLGILIVTVGSLYAMALALGIF